MNVAQNDTAIIDNSIPSVNQSTPTDVMEIPETDYDPANQTQLITEDLAVLEPDERDIFEEITHLESFSAYARGLDRETRGYTSDYL